MDEHLPSTKNSVVTQLFGDQGFAYFWDARFLPRWLPLLLSLGLGLALAVLIVNQAWHLALALTLAIPAVILFLRYPFAGVLIWLLILPFFLDNPTIVGKLMFWMLHRVMVPAALGLTVLSGWLGIGKKRPVRVGPAEWSMFLFLGLLFANILLFNDRTMRTMVDAYDEIVVPFCMYWLIRASAPDEKDMRLFLGVAFIALILQIAIGLSSWFAPQLLPPQWLGFGGARTVGSLRNPSVYSTTLLLLTVVLVHHVMRSKAKRPRVAMLFFLCLALYCVYLSFSRGSWLGASVVLLGLFFVYPRIMLRLVLILGFILLALGGSVLSGQLAWGVERLTSAEAQNSAESRVTGLDAALRMTRLKPFLGWGYGNFDEAKKSFMRRVGDIQIHEATSHNTYLTIAAELGLIALFLYLFPAGWLLVRSVKVRRKLPREGHFDLSLLLLLWLVVLNMFIVTNFMDMIRFYFFGTTIWWLMLGFIASIIDPYLAPQEIRAPAAVQSVAE